MQPRSQKVVPVLTFLCVITCYAYFIHFIGAGSWNAASRLNLTYALAEHGTFIIDKYHQNTGDKALYNGHYYTDKAPGPSFLAVPFYLVLKLFGVDSEKYIRYLLSFFVVGLPSALSVFLFLGILKMLDVANQWLRVVITLSYALGTLAFSFSTIFYGHQMAATCGIAAFYILLRLRTNPDQERATYILLSGFLSGLAYLSDYPAGIIMTLLFAYCLIVVRNKVMGLVWILGIALPLGTLMYYNTVCFGGPLASAYTHHVSYNHQSGFMGIGLPKISALWGITFSPYRGIFYHSPVLLLALPGTWLFYRQKQLRTEFWFCSAVVAAFLAFNSGYAYWDGVGTVGARFLVPCLPFLIILAFRAFIRWPNQAEILAVLSIFLMMVVCATEPRAPEKMNNPLLYWNFFNLFKGNLSDNLGRIIGFQDWFSFVPLALVVTTCFVLIRKSVPVQDLVRWDKTQAVNSAVLSALVITWIVGTGLLF